MKISSKAKNAIFIGVLCSVSYFAVYIARNILGAVSPQLISDGVYTEEFIGAMSSLFFISYAAGQLFNGILGDKIKAKYLISFGLLLAGVSNLVFAFLGSNADLAMVAYGFTGFFLSMIYGPMTKIVSENTDPLYAPRCSLGYTFSSFFGSPAAGALAAIMVWQGVFITSSAVLIGMAVVGFICFCLLERKGIIQYGQFKPSQKGVGSVRSLFKRNIIKFSLVSLLTGVVRTSVVFWLTTYIAQYLEYSEKEAAAIFMAATLVISASAFIAVGVFERLGNDMHKTVLIMFVFSAVFFALTYFVKEPVSNLVFIVLAILAADCASSVLWSVYCPSLRDTGIVSSATGFLDFLSYMGAAIANLAFANAINTIGWKNLILVWFALMLMGVIVCIPYVKIKERLKSH